MKKGILILIILIAVALVIGGVLLMKKPSNCAGSTCSVPSGTNAAGNSSVSSTLDSLSSDVATSETNDTAVTSDTNVIDTTGLS